MNDAEKIAQLEHEINLRDDIIDIYEHNLEEIGKLLPRQPLPETIPDIVKLHDRAKHAGSRARQALMAWKNARKNLGKLANQPNGEPPV